MATTKLRAARQTMPPARVTVTTLPSLDPVRTPALDPFWDTLYRIAQRLAAQATQTPVAA